MTLLARKAQRRNSPPTSPPNTRKSRRPPSTNVIQAQVLVADVLTYYAADKGSGGMDPATFDGMVALLGQRMGHQPIAWVRRSTCKAYVERRLQDPDRRYTKDPENAPRVSSETARRELEILSAAIGYWDGEHKLTSRPTVWLPDKPESARDALTRAQAAALLKAALGWRRIEKAGPVRPAEAQPAVGSAWAARRSPTGRTCAGSF
jgi:hypothetical protein